MQKWKGERKRKMRNNQGERKGNYDNINSNSAPTGYPMGTLGGTSSWLTQKGPGESPGTSPWGTPQRFPWGILGLNRGRFLQGIHEQPQQPNSQRPVSTDVFKPTRCRGNLHSGNFSRTPWCTPTVPWVPPGFHHLPEVPPWVSVEYLSVSLGVPS